jgi:DNA-binding beta-propeller fold protein YncE
MARRLYFLDQVRGAVMTALPDGSGITALVEGCAHPDGIVVDEDAGYLYWTNMGSSFDDANGSIERVRLDGSERTVIVPEGATRTPKQLRLDTASGHIYWCDREGMRVMRARLDGSAVETLVSTGDAENHRGDATRWCVGMALDLDRRQIYWTQKGPTNGGLGRIFRAPMDLPEGADATASGHVELLIDRLPEPVDLELSADGRGLYWTDRASIAGGSSISRAAIDPVTGVLGEPESLVTGMDRPIGLTLDRDTNRLFATDLGGNLHAGDLDGRGWNRLLSDAGKLTGICHL